jgi:hypothetical protein
MPSSWDSTWLRELSKPSSSLLAFPVGTYDPDGDAALEGVFEWVLWPPGADPAAGLRQFRRTRRWRALRHRLRRYGWLAVLAIGCCVVVAVWMLMWPPVWTVSRVNADALAISALLVGVGLTLWWWSRTPAYGRGEELTAWNLDRRSRCVRSEWVEASEYAGLSRLVWMLRNIERDDAATRRGASADADPRVAEAHALVWNCVTGNEQPSDATVLTATLRLEHLIREWETARQRSPQLHHDEGEDVVAW